MEYFNRLLGSSSFSMLQQAVSGGVNLLDTAWPYHEGESERLLGRWLANSGQRTGLILQSKLPVWLVKEAADMDRFLDRQKPAGGGAGDPAAGR